MDERDRQLRRLEQEAAACPVTPLLLRRRASWRTSSSPRLPPASLGGSSRGRGRGPERRGSAGGDVPVPEAFGEEAFLVQLRQLAELLDAGFQAFRCAPYFLAVRSARKDTKLCELLSGTRR